MYFALGCHVVYLSKIIMKYSRRRELFKYIESYNEIVAKTRKNRKNKERDIF